MLKKLRPSICTYMTAQAIHNAYRDVMKGLSSIVFFFGVVMIGMGLINTFGGLIAMRVLLGVFEVGVSAALGQRHIYLDAPGWSLPRRDLSTLALVRTFVQSQASPLTGARYPRSMLQFRIGFFFSAATIAGKHFVVTFWRIFSLRECLGAFSKSRCVWRVFAR